MYGSAVIEDDQACLCLVTTKKRMNVTISLDQSSILNQDNSLNFVMVFDRRIIEKNKFFFLDVIIYSRLNYENNEGEKKVSENICLVATYDLEKGFPIKNTEKNVENVRKFDLSQVCGKYQSMASDQVKLNFFIKFYLSGLSKHFNQEVLEIPLNFLPIENEITFLDAKEIKKRFRGLENLVRSKDIILLPYIRVDCQENFSSDGLFVTEKEKEANRKNQEHDSEHPLTNDEKT